MTGIENSDVKEINLINNELNKYKHHYKMFVRLSVVKMVLQGATRGEAAEAFNVHRKSAENWVKIYNEKGISGLEPDYSKCGADSKLSNEQLEELKNILINSKKDYNVSSVNKLIEEKFGIKYSYKQTWVIVNKKLELNK
jgi:transposase